MPVKPTFMAATFTGPDWAGVGEDHGASVTVTVPVTHETALDDPTNERGRHGLRQGKSAS